MSAAAKHEEKELLSYPARRFGIVDLGEKAVWLGDRLRLRYPHLGDNRMIVGWLRGMIDSNECLFIRNPHAVCLAQVVKETLSPQPTVVERFVLAEDPANELHVDHAASLYDDMLLWAESVKAKEMVVEKFTDVPRPIIKERIGRLTAREEMVVKLGR